MPNTSIVSPEDQGATFVELFFDLVFVFAVTQITHYAAHHLDVTGILRSVVIFWLVWWGWTQFTWALNAADTEHQGVRAITLLATGVAFVMAVSVENGFSPELREVLPFAASYVAIRILGRARARGGGRRSGRDRRDRTGDHSPTTGPLEARVDGTEETPV